MIRTHPDFPAAHSMDTTWFAVDSAGNVGMFNSGEMGAVPKHIDKDESNALEEPILQFLARQSYIRGVLKRAQHRALIHEEGEVFFFMISSDKCVDADWQELLGDGSSDWIVRRGISAEEYAQIHANETCKGCCTLSHVVYLFWHDDLEDVTPAPYARSEIPQSPVSISDLPAELLTPELVHSFAMLNFGATPKLQPLEHGPCENWTAEEYLTVDGQVKRIPLHSDQRAQMQKFRNQLKGFKFEIASPSDQTGAAPNEIRMVLKKAEAPAPRPQPEVLTKPQQQPRRPWWKFW